MNFDLKRPCKDCPFIVGTSMTLDRGRMPEIVDSLRSDLNVFPCHKTANSSRDDSDEDGYTYGGSEQACMGALAYTLREFGMMPVMARIACMRDTRTPEAIREFLPRDRKARALPDLREPGS